MPDDGNPGLAAATTFYAPSYLPSDPAMWFNILECSFKASNISSSLTKYTRAASLLPSEVLSQVSDIITAASTSEHPYEDLKAALLQRLQSSVTTRLRELLSKEELGSEKPSDLLRRMTQLLGDKYQSFDRDLFKQLFYQRLPPAIQASLFSVKDSLEPDAIAKLADDFMASQPPAPSVSAVASPEAAVLSKLLEQVSLLQTTVTSLQKQLDDTRRSRSRTRSPTPRRRQYRSRSRSSPGVCWYHRRFGTSATKCTSPCTYKASNASDGQ